MNNNAFRYYLLLPQYLLSVINLVDKYYKIELCNHLQIFIFS